MLHHYLNHRISKLELSSSWKTVSNVLQTLTVKVNYCISYEKRLFVKQIRKVDDKYGCNDSLPNRYKLISWQLLLRLTVEGTPEMLNLFTAATQFNGGNYATALKRRKWKVEQYYVKLLHIPLYTWYITEERFILEYWENLEYIFQVYR